MGTRSITRVVEDGQQIVNMYVQFDGYPSGHGHDIFQFLDGMAIVNGLHATQAKKIDLQRYISKDLGVDTLDNWLRDNRPKLPIDRKSMDKYRLQWIDWMIASLEGRV